MLRYKFVSSTWIGNGQDKYSSHVLDALPVDPFMLYDVTSIELLIPMHTIYKVEVLCTVFDSLVYLLIQTDPVI